MLGFRGTKPWIAGQLEIGTYWSYILKARCEQHVSTIEAFCPCNHD